MSLKYEPTSPHGPTKSPHVQRQEYSTPGTNWSNRWASPRIRGAGKVNLEFEIDRFGRSVRDGRKQPIRRNVKRFRGELVFKAHRLVYHSTLGWIVTKKKKGWCEAARADPISAGVFFFFFFFTLVTGPRRSLSRKLSDTRVYEP